MAERAQATHSDAEEEIGGGGTSEVRDKFAASSSPPLPPSPPPRRKRTEERFANIWNGCGFPGCSFCPDSSNLLPESASPRRRTQGGSIRWPRYLRRGKGRRGRWKGRRRRKKDLFPPLMSLFRFLLFLPKRKGEEGGLRSRTPPPKTRVEERFAKATLNIKKYLFFVTAPNSLPAFHFFFLNVWEILYRQMGAGLGRGEMGGGG